MENLGDARRRSAEGASSQPVAPARFRARFLVERWLALLIVLILLALWELLSDSSVISRIFFPAPSRIMTTLWELIVSGRLVTHLFATLQRLLLGLVLGCVPGLILGLAMGWSRTLRAAIDPIVSALHPIPKIAILPLFLIIFGIGETSKVMLIAVASFFPMVISSMAGVQQIGATYFDVATNYGAGRLQTFWRVVLPGSLPLVLTGLRLALNIALLLTIAAELLSAQEGLGTMISFAWRTLRTTEMYAALAVIAALGIVFAALVQWLMKRLVPWHETRMPTA